VEREVGEVVPHKARDGDCLIGVAPAFERIPVGTLGEPVLVDRPDTRVCGDNANSAALAETT